MISSNNQQQYISVSEYANMVGKSTQTIYNRIKDGTVKYITFSRGKYKGILIKNPDYNG